MNQHDPLTAEEFRREYQNDPQPDWAHNAIPPEQPELLKQARWAHAILSDSQPLNTDTECKEPVRPTVSDIFREAIEKAGGLPNLLD